MTYELALKLKDAGFPLIKCNLDECWYSDGSLETKDGNFHYPDLTELIEACGIWFYELIKRDDDTWYAGTKLNENRPRYGIGTGSTPEEAIANLWLQLNKK